MDENKMGVILEKVVDMFETLAEGQKIIEGDVKELKVRVGNVENRLANLELKADSIDNRLIRVESDVKTIKGYIVGVDDTMNDHEKRIRILENKEAVS